MNWSVWLNTYVSIGDFVLPFSPKGFLLRFAVPVLAILIVSFAIGLIIRRAARAGFADEARRAVFLKWARRVIRILVAVGVLLSAGSLLGAEAWNALGDFFRILNKPFFATGNTRISVVSLILIIPVIAVASWAGKLVSRGFNTGALARFGLDAEQTFSIGRLVRYSVMVLVFIFGLSIVGIDLSAIGVLFGVLGIGIGFGLQSLIADFFAGITLIGMGLIKEGDRIRVSDNHDGIIRRIRLMNTELLNFENETLIIPNSQLTGGTIHNFSYKDRRVVIVNEVDVSYNSNLDDVIAVLRSVADRNPWRPSTSEVLVRVRTFAESGITMELRLWIGDVANRADAHSWTNLEIWRAFAAHGIEIPFPQRVVHQATVRESAPVLGSKNAPDDLLRAGASPDSSIPRPSSTDIETSAGDED